MTLNTVRENIPMITAVLAGAENGCASDTFATGPNLLENTDFEISHVAILGAKPVSSITPAKT